jgi:signal transduction histidine kinase
MRAAPLRTARAADSTAKLALLERLLGVMDVVECVEATLAWLASQTGADQAICALADSDTGLIHGIAGHHVTASQIGSVYAALDAATHPLVRAMQSPEPIVLEGTLGQGVAGSGAAAEPFGRARYWALPLATRGTGQPAGGLLLAALNGPPTADVIWLVDVLSQKLHTLLARDALAEAQGKLRRERSLLDAVINAVADPILLTDTEGRLLIANGRAEALFSTSPIESEGRRRAVELNNMFLSAALWRIAVGAGQVAPQELLVVDPVDGSDLLFELLGTVVHDPREGTGIVSVLRNVTDLRRATEELSENYRRIRLAEAEVRSERDRLDVIIDSVADPILVCDDAGKVTLMNAPAERLFTDGSAGDEPSQRHLRANDAHFSSFISGLLSDGTEIRRRGEISLTEVATGVSMPYEAIAGKVLSEAGELVAVVTILHDRSEALERARLYEQVKQASNELEAKVLAATTELARQNKLLRHQAVELEQASALKSQFLANMSHEFRTPLNAILGYASILLQGISGELTPGQRKALDRIASNGRHLVGIVSEILDLSRIEAGRMPLQISTFTSKQLVEEVLAEMEPIVARSKLTVTSHVAPDLGPIVSDRQKVKQVVLNLLSNALKFTREGSVTIRAAYADTPGMVTIAITDTGIGIDPSDHEKIFEDFQQVDSSVARPYGGTGLGLSICRRLATMLGGRLDMVSEVGRGSTFTLVVASRLRK